MQSVEARFGISISLSRFRSGLMCLAAVLAVATACVAQEGKPSETPEAPAAQTADAAAHPAKDSKPPKPGESDRKKLIADQSAQLLEMALALKAEVDKTTKDTLSLTVIKKADEIEKLAKSVKEKMKQN